MPECTNCGTTVDDAANFCPNCGEPRNEKARKKLDRMIETQAEQKAKQRSTQAASGSGSKQSPREELLSRVSYALGFVFVVAAISVLPNPGGAPILLGGILLFPPVRLMTARIFGSPLKIEANAVIAVFLGLIGAALVFLL